MRPLGLGTASWVILRNPDASLRDAYLADRTGCTSRTNTTPTTPLITRHLSGLPFRTGLPTVPRVYVKHTKWNFFAVYRTQPTTPPLADQSGSSGTADPSLRGSEAP